MHIWVEKILEGNATKCFISYLGIVDLLRGFSLSFLHFPNFLYQGCITSNYHSIVTF